MNKIIAVIVWLFFMPVFLFAQSKGVTLSGKIQENTQKTALAYVNIVLKKAKDSVFVAGTVTNEEGLFSFSELKQGNYILQTSYIGYQTHFQAVLIGQLSNFLDLGTIGLSENKALNEVVVTAKQDEISSKLDKKSYSTTDNISQGGGSVLQMMSNLPSVTVRV